MMAEAKQLWVETIKFVEVVPSMKAFEREFQRVDSSLVPAKGDVFTFYIDEGERRRFVVTSVEWAETGWKTDGFDVLVRLTEVIGGA
jgi:hypothetical protein